MIEKNYVEILKIFKFRSTFFSNIKSEFQKFFNHQLTFESESFLCKINCILL